MNTYVNYADKLRNGGLRRDASDKIKGFIYQDIVALEIILNSADEDKIYLEWVENIDKPSILLRLSSLGDMTARETLIIDEVASSNILNEIYICHNLYRIFSCIYDKTNI